jgi:hypothetical protein
MSVFTTDDRAAVADFVADLLEGTITVHRQGLAAMDPVTLEVAATSGGVVYSGPARVPIVTPSGPVSVGEGQIPQRTVGFTVPLGAGDFRNDDTVTIDAMPDGSDTTLVGSAWRVTGVSGGGAFGALCKLTATQWFRNGRWDGT